MGQAHEDPAPVGSNSFIIDYLRWIFVSSLAYLACILYVLALVSAIRLLSPEYLEEIGGGEMRSLAFLGVLRKAWVWGSYVGIPLAPFVSFTIIKQVNTSLTEVSQDAHWWRRSHRAVGILLLVMLGVALAFGLLGACPALLRGKGWEEARTNVCRGLLLGSMWGAAVFAFGPLLSALRGRDSDGGMSA